jgi:hypothetical protein
VRLASTHLWGASVHVVPPKHGSGIWHLRIAAGDKYGWIRLTPTSARRIASKLTKWADERELPPTQGAEGEKP